MIIEKWKRPSYYMGESWPEMYVGLFRNRDSDCLERSNFEIALEHLGGEGETVHIIREGHWACGWVEWIAIHESDTPRVQAMNQLFEQLEEYPVLDECHFSALEQEKANDVWKNCYDANERIKYIRANIDQCSWYDWSDLLACVRGKFFCGYASDLLH